MSESRYEKLCRLTTEFNKILEQSQESVDTVISTKMLPMIMSDEEIQRVINFFKQAIYFKKDRWTSKIGIKEFDLVGKEMVVGIKIDKVILDDGKQIELPGFSTGEKARSTVINDQDDIDSCLRQIFTVLPFKTREEHDQVTNVTGEVYLKFYPGYLKVPVSKANVDKPIEADGLHFTVEEFGSRHIVISMNKENSANYKLEAFNKKGERLEVENWVRATYFDGKTAQDFTEESLPKAETSDKYRYIFLFNGDIESADIYFDRKTETHWLPFTTSPKLPSQLDEAYFRSISIEQYTWRVSLLDVVELTKEEVASQISVEVEKGGGFNDPEDQIINIRLPQLGNTLLANIVVTDLFLENKKTKKKQYYTISTASGLVKTDKIYVGSDEYSLKNKVPFESRIYHCAAKIFYPLKLNWKSFTKTKNMTEDKELVFDGGLIEYHLPDHICDKAINAYSIDNMVRAYNHSGNSLARENYHFDKDQRILKVGFLGVVDSVDVLNVEESTIINYVFSCAAIDAYTEEELKVIAELQEERGW